MNIPPAQQIYRIALRERGFLFCDETSGGAVDAFFADSGREPALWDARSLDNLLEGGAALEASSTDLVQQGIGIASGCRC